MMNALDILSRHPTIPSGVINSLVGYVNHRQQPGHFVRAVLENNLFAAMQRADSQSRKALPEIVDFIYDALPGNCYGDPQKVSAWLHPQPKPCAEVDLTDPTNLTTVALLCGT